jgi:hypothetical protein
MNFRAWDYCIRHDADGDPLQRDFDAVDPQRNEHSRGAHTGFR